MIRQTLTFLVLIGFLVSHYFIVIFGPTGVGKTDFAEKIASAISGEIINADLGQFYTPLSIGTAKPQWRESSIPQHLFDSIDTPQSINVTQYRTMALQEIQSVYERNAVPLLVGGSGFYLRSLFFPPSSGSAQKNVESIQGAPPEKNWDLLHQIDPMRASQIHPHDNYRINRAIELYHTTGQKPSDFAPHYESVGRFLFIYLLRNKDDLYQKIDQRTCQMIKEGWVQEVEQLRGTGWEPFLKNKKIIGYDDILEYLENKNTGKLESLIQTIAQKTRNYAKRQITFGNKLFKDLQEALRDAGDSESHCVRYNLSQGSLETYTEQLMKIIRTMNVKRGTNV